MACQIIKNDNGTVKEVLASNGEPSILWNTLESLPFLTEEQRIDIYTNTQNVKKGVLDGNGEPILVIEMNDTSSEVIADGITLSTDFFDTIERNTDKEFSVGYISGNVENLDYVDGTRTQQIISYSNQITGQNKNFEIDLEGERVFAINKPSDFKQLFTLNPKGDPTTMSGFIINNIKKGKIKPTKVSENIQEQTVTITEIDVNPNERTIVAVVGDKKIGSINLVPQGENYTVDTSNLREEYQGNYIGTSMYLEAIETMDRPVISDMYRTEAAEKVWNRLVTDGYAERMADGRFISKRNQNQSKITVQEAIKRNNGNPLTKAPNGNPSILYQSYKDLGYTDSETEQLVAQVYSDEFGNWFGRWWEQGAENVSKVVDENGMPRLVFHGSEATDFNVFSISDIVDGGFFFTDDKNMAQSYGSGVMLSRRFLRKFSPQDFSQEKLTFDYDRDDGLGTLRYNGLYIGVVTNDRYEEVKGDTKMQDRVIELHNSFVDNINKKTQEEEDYGQDTEGTRVFFLNIKNAEEVDGKGANWKNIVYEGEIKKTRDIVEIALNKGKNGVIIRKIYDYGGAKLKNLLGYSSTGLYTEKGYMSFEDLEKEVMQRKASDVFVVYNNNQIKSATENIGTFDSTNPDIRFQISANENVAQQNREVLTAILERLGQTKLASNVYLMTNAEINAKLEELGTNATLSKQMDNLDEGTKQSIQYLNNKADNSVELVNKATNPKGKGLLTQSQLEELQKEIENSYAVEGQPIKLGKSNDIRQSLFNYETPVASKNVNGVDVRIVDGLIRNIGTKDAYKTYLMYANSRLVGEFNSVESAKDVINFIEKNLIKVLPTQTDFNDDGTVKDSVIKEIEEERATIEKEAKENGTWLKAPNGKDTNLSDEQWVTVRTKRFKNWSNNWENSLKDEQGEPKIYFHGSDSLKDISVFKSNKGNEYSFFAEEKYEAERYLTKESAMWADTQGVGEFFIKAEIVLDIRGEKVDSKLRNFINTNSSKILKEAEDFAALEKEMFFEDYGWLLEEDNLSETEITEKWDSTPPSEKIVRILERGSNDWKILETETMQNYIISEGYDAFKTNESEGNIAIYNPNQIKSATGNIGTFSVGNNNINFQKQNLTNENMFYSNSLEGIKKIKQTKATPEQWINMIIDKGGKGTSQELEWIGLEDYLNSIYIGKDKVNINDQKAVTDKYIGSIPKEVVEQYINDNQIEIVEVAKEDKGGEFYTNEEGYERWGEKDDTKYSNYQLDGGQNYREVLLTLPKKRFEAKVSFEKWNENRATWGKLRGTIEEYKEAMSTPIGNENYKSSHWDESNILAHLRINERTLPNGERVMFIEEVQSDWAQEGKKKGFDDKKQDLTPKYRRLDNGIDFWQIGEEAQKGEVYFDPDRKDIVVYTARSGNKMQDFSTKEEAIKFAQDNLPKTKTGLPDMPYKKTDQWVGMAMRRAMQMAAQEGFDRIAWITGEQSAERYDLSDKVDYIQVDSIQGQKLVEIQITNSDNIYLNVDGTGSIIENTLQPKLTEEELNLLFDRRDSIYIREVNDKLSEMKEESKQLYITGKQEESRLLKIKINEKKKELEKELLESNEEYRELEEKVKLNNRLNKFLEKPTTSEYVGKNLSDVIGKELAEKVLKTENEAKYKGQDLKVGGEGMKTFYNSILPKVAKKESQRFDKKAKVEVVDFNDSNNKSYFETVEVEGENFYKLMVNGEFIEGVEDSTLRVNNFSENEEGARKYLEEYIPQYTNTKGAGKQLSIPITPKMKEAFKQGVPLFQKNNTTQTTTGFVNQNTGEVYLNTDNPNILETSLHEHGHLYLNWLQQNKNDFFREGLKKIDLTEAQPYKEYVKQNQPNLREGTEAFRIETLAQVIGDNGAKLVNNLDTRNYSYEQVKNLIESGSELTPYQKNIVADKIEKERQRYTDEIYNDKSLDSKAFEKALQDKTKELRELKNKVSDFAGLQGDVDADVAYHFTDQESILSILGDNTIEGYGDVSGVSTTTFEGFGNTVKWFGENNKPVTFAEGGIRIDLDLQKIKDSSERIRVGSAELGTFAGEYELKIGKAEGIKNISEFIKNINIDRNVLTTEEVEEVTKLAAEKNIAVTYYSAEEVSEKLSLKEWLDNLWNYIKEALGLSDYTITQVQNMTLSEYATAINIDMLKGKTMEELYPPQQAIQQISKDKLLAVHNISESNLRNVVNQGGLAVPSIAVINTDFPFTSFGEITLVGDKTLIDPRASRLNKAFASDSYSVRYPRATNFTNSTKVREWNKRIEVELPYLDERSNDFLRNFDDRGRDDLENSRTLQLLYLKQQGKDKDFVFNKPEIPQKYLNRFEKLLDKTKDSFDFTREDGKVYNEFKKIVEDKGLEDLKSGELTEEEISELFPIVSKVSSNYYYIFRQSLKASKEKELSVYKTFEKIPFDKKEQGFQDFIDEVYDSLDVVEKIFKGYTASGNRQYVPHTLENVVRMMKGGARKGEGFFYGVGSVRAGIVKQFKSISDIKKSQDRIVSSEDFEKLKEEINDEFLEIGNILKPFYKYQTDSFGYYDNVGESLIEFFNRGYAQNFNKLDKDTEQKVKEFLDKLYNLPTEYFEVKIERAVDLSEFKGALVPQNISPKTKEILSNAGLKVVEYSGNRQEQLAEFSELAFQKQQEYFKSNPDIRFQIIGEQGANNVVVEKNLLDLAKKLKEQGTPLQDIESKTGWLFIDNQWKKLSTNLINKFKVKLEAYEKINEPQKLSDVLEDQSLFDYYPTLSSVEVVFYNKKFKLEGKTNILQSENLLGNFDESEGENGTLFIKSYLKEKGLGVIAHELSHKIQQIEGFPEGGNRLQENRGQYFIQGKKEVSSLKKGTAVTENTIQLIKGTFGKRNMDGSTRTAHPNAQGIFTSVDEKVAERYADYKGANMARYEIPLGTTIEVVNEQLKGKTLSQLRKDETDAINESQAQIVKLITFDSSGKEEQYVIKDYSLVPALNEALINLESPETLIEKMIQSGEITQNCRV